MRTSSGREEEKEVRDVAGRVRGRLWMRAAGGVAGRLGRLAGECGMKSGGAVMTGIILCCVVYDEMRWDAGRVGEREERRG